jgi:nucleotide-binding universal stress UspA family protein
MARIDRRTTSPVASILLATDFSAAARAVELRALLLPAPPGRTIHLLHVVSTRLAEAAQDRAVDSAEVQLDLVAARIRRLARSHHLVEPRLVASVARGVPHVEIIRRARVAGVELVVMGRHGRRSFRELLVGTTTSRVVRYGDTPALVVNGRAAGPYRRLLVGVALDDASLQLVDLGARLVEAGSDGASLVHVCRAPPLGRFIAAATPRRDRAEDRRVESRYAAAGMKALERAVKGRLPGLALRPVVLHGDPRRLLPREAARWRADLVAVGTHGQTGLAHVLLGSVAERVLAAARCDVLVARPTRFTFRLP